MSAESAQQSAQLLYAPHVQHNTLTLTSIKFISSAFAGAVAGVLGLTNLAGFGLFALAMLWAAFCIYIICCQGKPGRYLASSVAGSGSGNGGASALMELLNPGSDNAFTFVLVWTLFYGIVHDNAMKPTSNTRPGLCHTVSQLC
ncbi:hypothetical protein BT96DRAFT_978060 [Gymnopus androsaceus JB14]|uniref:ER membrane protein complex subunit 6 n=1 Tax=Gymnopus androsaceus JB14 TaxID=1447944 RepID=A0A6A4HDX9_9AGAR|nr:hypothetical protein BT96DRAFT_978060 [Gymnopus androsaceus JB14]